MIKIKLKDGTVITVKDNNVESISEWSQQRAGGALLCKSCHTRPRQKISTLNFCGVCHGAWLQFKFENPHLFPRPSGADLS